MTDKNKNKAGVNIDKIKADNVDISDYSKKIKIRKKNNFFNSIISINIGRFGKRPKENPVGEVKSSKGHIDNLVNMLHHLDRDVERGDISSHISTRTHTDSGEPSHISPHVVVIVCHKFDHGIEFCVNIIEKLNNPTPTIVNLKTVMALNTRYEPERTIRTLSGILKVAKDAAAAERGKKASAYRYSYIVNTSLTDKNLPSIQKFIEAVSKMKVNPDNYDNYIRSRDVIFLVLNSPKELNHKQATAFKNALESTVENRPKLFFEKLCHLISSEDVQSWVISTPIKNYIQSTLQAPLMTTELIRDLNDWYGEEIYFDPARVKIEDKIRASVK